MQADNFFETVYRIINKYNTKTKSPKQYGTEQLLYSSEVHMIEVIGGHGHLTATCIASLLGITKGAVSQTTNKLLIKGLIKKEVSPAGNNEILISLTDSGKVVYHSHLKLHSDLICEVSNLAADLPEESLDIIQNILKTIDTALDHY